MYENFYGFRNKPFSLLPDPEFLYLSKKHHMALALLEYGLWNQASFSVITGGIGTGKTTMIRHLLNKLERNLVVGLISNTHPSFGELLQWILLAFNLEYSGKDKVGMYKTFVDFLIREYAANRRVVLVVDEAQNMSPQALEELRMLSNINAEKDQVLQIILVGQAGLRERLRDPGLEQFAQRIAVDYHLDALDADEAQAYISHRLSVAGGDPGLFNDDACNAIFQYSGGIPRLINLLCDTALVYGYAEQKLHIDLQLIHDVAQEKQRTSILPLKQVRQDRGEIAETNIDVSGVKSQFRKKLRVLIISDSESQRVYLKMVLERSGVQVVSAVPIGEELFRYVELENVDAVLVDLDENNQHTPDYLPELLDRLQNQCRMPILFNDSSMIAKKLSTIDFGKKLTLKLTSLVSRV